MLVPDYSGGDPAADNETLALTQMNETYYVVMDGAKTRVMFFDKVTYPLQHKAKKERTLTRYVPTFLGFDDFKNYEYHPKMLFFEVGRKPKMMGLGQWWLENPRRNQYAGVVFEPNKPEIIGNKLNLWRGWGVDPRQGDWSLLRNHIREIICNNDKKRFRYLMNWLAWTIQNPNHRAEIRGF
jgi:hypothetical protein